MDFGVLKGSPANLENVVSLYIPGVSGCYRLERYYRESFFFVVKTEASGENAERTKTDSSLVRRAVPLVSDYFLPFCAERRTFGTEYLHKKGMERRLDAQRRILEAC